MSRVSCRLFSDWNWPRGFAFNRNALAGIASVSVHRLANLPGGATPVPAPPRENGSPESKGSTRQDSNKRDCTLKTANRELLCEYPLKRFESGQSRESAAPA